MSAENLKHRIQVITDVFNSRVDSDVKVVEDLLLDIYHGKETGDYIENNRRIVRCLERITTNIHSLDTLNTLLADLVEKLSKKTE